MEALIKRLSTQKSVPGLWIERLAIFHEPNIGQCIRAIEFRRGLNLIWAHEPPDDSVYTGIHAAGHGVGKTSLCLLLRYCLGDTAKLVVDLREELFVEFPRGGVGAVLHVANEAYTVFRFFNPHKEGSAFSGDDLETLLEEGGSLSFKDFEIHLAKTMMSRVSPQLIPDTGQAIEWRHVLAWMTRDQGSRFKTYFSWREGEGTGLQRTRQDPPIVMRAVLGLLDQGESALLGRVRSLERDLEVAQQEAARLKQEPILILRRIESELRAWLNVPEDLPLRSDDMFKESVEKTVETARAKATDNLNNVDALYEVANEKLAELRAELLLQERGYEQADKDYQLADAARRQDESAYQQIASRREALVGLTDWCEPGDIPFADCEYIQGEIKKLEAVNLRDRRDQSALVNVGEYWTARAVKALARRSELRKGVERAQQNHASVEQESKSLRIKRDSAALEADRGLRLLSELERWERTSGSPKAAEAIERSVVRTDDISRSIDSAHVQLLLLQQERSGREQKLGEYTDTIARALLSNEVFGGFAPRDENRPFQLSVRGGEAYRVLEVLLGDLTCMLDAANSASTFPGFLVHDCPREADMSSGLYKNFLLLVERIEREAYGDEAPFQYIVTTTTPPPSLIQQLPYLRETLDPSTDEGFLFRRRFGRSE